MNDVMPGSDGPENLKIVKKRQLEVDHGQCRLTVGFGCHCGRQFKFGPDNGVEKLGSD